MPVSDVIVPFSPHWRYNLLVGGYAMLSDKELYDLIMNADEDVISSVESFLIEVLLHPERQETHSCNTQSIALPVYLH